MAAARKKVKSGISDTPHPLCWQQRVNRTECHILTQDRRRGLLEASGHSYRNALQGTGFRFQRTSRDVSPDIMGAESFHPAASSSLLLLSFQGRGSLCLLSVCMDCLHSQDYQLCWMARRPTEKKHGRGHGEVHSIKLVV